MCFKAQGLVLGADTVIAPAADDADGGDPTNGEARILALLSTAYGRGIGEEVLGHIHHALQKWRAAQTGPASVHLALTRLERLAKPQEAARRLFFADALMAAGTEPKTIFSAQGLEAPADHTRELFAETGGGLERIEIDVLPYQGTRK